MKYCYKQWTTKYLIQFLLHLTVLPDWLPKHLRLPISRLEGRNGTSHFVFLILLFFSVLLAGAPVPLVVVFHGGVGGSDGLDNAVGV